VTRGRANQSPRLASLTTRALSVGDCVACVHNIRKEPLRRGSQWKLKSGRARDIVHPLTVRCQPTVSAAAGVPNGEPSGPRDFSIVLKSGIEVPLISTTKNRSTGYGPILACCGHCWYRKSDRADIASHQCFRPRSKAW